MKPTRATMTKRFSPILFAVIMITLMLSLVFIYEGLIYYLNDNVTTGAYYLAVGISALAISTYFLYQTRQRMARLTSMMMQPLNTTIECGKCGFKNVREFQRGDYVFKTTEDQCPKCNEKAMSVGSIYREVKEKEKAKEIG